MLDIELREKVCELKLLNGLDSETVKQRLGLYYERSDYINRIVHTHGEDFLIGRLGIDTIREIVNHLKIMAIDSRKARKKLLYSKAVEKFSLPNRTIRYIYLHFYKKLERVEEKQYNLRCEICLATYKGQLGEKHQCL